MKVVVAPRAERDLARQIDYIIEKGAPFAARRLQTRIETFIERTLVSHPRVGAFLVHRDLWEMWVPGTKLVLWYRFTSSELQIVRIWHRAQDRENS